MLLSSPLGFRNEAPPSTSHPALASQGHHLPTPAVEYPGGCWGHPACSLLTLTAAPWGHNSKHPSEWLRRPHSQRPRGVSQGQAGLSAKSDSRSGN